MENEFGDVVNDALIEKAVRKIQVLSKNEIDELFY